MSLETSHDEKTTKGLLSNLEKQYYPMATVVKRPGFDADLAADVVQRLESKGGWNNYITAQWGDENTILECYGLQRWNGPGDVTIFGSGDLEPLKNWANRKDKFHAPRTVHDACGSPEFQLALEEMFHNTVTFCHAFPAEDEEERLDELGALDLPDEAEDEETTHRQMRSQEEAERIFDQEEQMLEEIPLPNLPRDEKERREQWMSLPRATRLAVRKMHRQFGHVSPRVLLEILRASGAKSEFLKAARTLRCEGCDAHKPKPQTQKVGMPRTFEFNNTIGVDIFEVKDVNGQRYSILSMVDQGTCFHQAKVVRIGGGQPSSTTCFRAFQSTWTAWAGQPREVISDRGLRNRGAFSEGLAARGTIITNVGVESPEQIGRTERHGGLLKSMVIRTISELKLAGEEAVTEALTQCIVTKNSLSRVKGFAPIQWVLGKLPREPGTVFEEDSWADLGSLQCASDSQHEFGRIAMIREKARKAFIRADMSSRVSRAILRKAAPIVKEYAVGDLVCFRTDQQGWSTACRIIGFDGEKIAWVLHRGVPACVATDRLRPVNASEALAFQFLHRQPIFQFGERNQQQGYLDLRNELPPVPEEDEDDDGVYEPPEPGEIAVEPEQQEQVSRETSAVNTEPEVEMMPPSRRRSLEEHHDVPVSIRRRLSKTQTQSPTESRATESRAAPETSPLVENWNRTGTTGPGVQMADRGFDEAHNATLEDTWHLNEEIGILVREHNIPRMALFSLDDVADCPVSKDKVTKGRITEARHVNGKETIMQDSWNDGLGAKMIGREWTGKTMFFLKDSKAIKRKAEIEEGSRFAEERELTGYNAEGKQLSKNAKKKMRGKVFDYESVDEETRRGIDGSRQTEWDKWKKFMAVQIVFGATLTKLLAEGHKPIPTQWIDTDKHEHLKREGKKHNPFFKSRLVARGDLEQSYSEIRTDSPTAEVSALNLVLAWCAAWSLKICSIDITNAYFHGMILDRLMLLRLPRGGLPDESVPAGAMILARVPIYGTRDAGRRIWAKLKQVLENIGFKQNSQSKALFTLTEDGDVKVMIACHVDDLLYATKPGYEKYILKVLEAFHVEESKISEKKFRFCGRELEQDDDMNIKVTCTATAEKIELIKYRNGLKKTEEANQAENAQLRSVVGSLAWVARQARPDLSYRVSKLQSVCGRATIKDLQYADAVVRDAHEYSKHGIIFEAGAVDWNQMVLCTVSDASWSNESEMVRGKMEPFRSQRARMTILTNKNMIKGDGSKFYPLEWSSTTIKRVCRSTLQAESYAMSTAVEEGMKTRAMITCCHNKLDLKNWEDSSREFMQHVWLTDCRSLREHLCSATLAKTADKRLSVDLAALRQLIWEKGGQETEELTIDHPDQIKWIDTSVMLVDCLTKDMSGNALRATMKSGYYDITPTAESEITKMAKQKWRKMQREKKNSNGSAETKENT